MQTTAGVSCSRTSGNKTNTRLVGELARGLRHIRRTTLISANSQCYFRGVVQCVEGGEKTLSRDAENAIDRIDFKRIDQNSRTGSGTGLIVHVCFTAKCVLVEAAASAVAGLFLYHATRIRTTGRFARPGFSLLV